MKITNPSGTKKVNVKADENLKIFLEDFEFGSRSFELEVNLQGDNTQCEIIGRVQTTGKDQKSWKVIQKISGKNQVAKIDLHGTAEEESQLNFDGAAVLASTSEGAEVSVSEKIWLFDQAKGKSLPVLTVKTDRVKSAHHSAAIMQMDAELLFFAESRGISEKEAKALLKQGFLKIT